VIDEFLENKVLNELFFQGLTDGMTFQKTKVKETKQQQVFALIESFQFIFSPKEKLAVFHSTGQDSNSQYQHFLHHGTPQEEATKIPVFQP
jgi:hypothetical protein